MTRYKNLLCVIGLTLAGGSAFIMSNNGADSYTSQARVERPYISERANRSAKWLETTTTTVAVAVTTPATSGTNDSSVASTGKRTTPAPNATTRQVGYASPTSNNSAKAYIYRKESTNNPCAYYPSKSDCNYAGEAACGLGGAKPCSKMRNECGPSLDNYACQDRWFDRYAVARYGSWERAEAFHKANGWW